MSATYELFQLKRGTDETAVYKYMSYDWMQRYTLERQQ